MMSQGYLYILFNPSLRPNRYKIGMTVNSPEERAADISRATGVPQPYEVAYQIHVRDCRQAEQLVKDRLVEQRISSNREFFEIPLHEAVAMLNAVGEEIGIVEEPAKQPTTQEKQTLQPPEMRSPLPEGEIDIETPARRGRQEAVGKNVKRGRKTVEEHLRVCDAQRQELFRKFSILVKDIDDGIDENSWSYGVAYRFGKNFVELYFRTNRLEVCLRPRLYTDPKNLLGRVPENYEWTLNRRFMLEQEGQLDYLLKLVRQSYEDVR